MIVRNIIFDWSGTLVDDLPAVWNATNHVFTQAGVPEITLDYFRAEFRLPFAHFYDAHVPHISLEQLEFWFHSRFREVQDLVTELPHARAFLEFCRARKIRTLLLSSVTEEHWRNQADKVGFTSFIDHPYTGVHDKREKIHAMLELHGLNPDETLFIGDMQHDIETARHGGVHSCAVLTGYNRLEQLRASNPDVIVEHLGELQRLLEARNLSLSAWATVERFPLSTVGALIREPGGKLLMIQTQKWSHMWGIPGGKIKYGESSLEALRREVKEETNLELGEIRFVMVQDCIESKEFYRPAHFLLLNYLAESQPGGEVILNEEAVGFRWVTKHEALVMNLNTPTRILLDECERQGWL
jgi:phosphoglycolate phosphatase-like HAD superfamily hydrolase/ADP-ribose pyrophosphatase YjhB (NUDIX family)